MGRYARFLLGKRKEEQAKETQALPGSRWCCSRGESGGRREGRVRQRQWLQHTSTAAVSHSDRTLFGCHVRERFGGWCGTTAATDATGPPVSA